MVVSEKEVDEEISKESKDKTEDYRKLKYYQVSYLLVFSWRKKMQWLLAGTALLVTFQKDICIKAKYGSDLLYQNEVVRKKKTQYPSLEKQMTHLICRYGNNCTTSSTTRTDERRMKWREEVSRWKFLNWWRIDMDCWLLRDVMRR